MSQIITTMSSAVVYSGPFWAHPLRARGWRLSGPQDLEIFIRDPGGDVSNALGDVRIEAVHVDWSHTPFTVTVVTAAGSRTLAAKAVWVQEEPAGLYDDLPLAVFDSPARSFWNGMFRILRIPGGRFALQIIARFARSSRD